MLCENARLERVACLGMDDHVVYERIKIVSTMYWRVFYLIPSMFHAIGVMTLTRLSVLKAADNGKRGCLLVTQS